MSVIKKSSFPLHLDVYNVFINDTNPNSRYFKVTQLNDVFTGGKNGFLIQGAPELKEGSYIFLEIKDSAGAIIYTEIAGGKPGEYYEGVSKPISAHVYDDTAFGAAIITIVGELKEWDDNGVIRPIPDEWIGKINVKWQKTVTVNPFIANVSPVRLYKRPEITITEKLLPIYSVANSRIILTGSLKGRAITPTDGTSYPYAGPITYEIESINPTSASIKFSDPLITPLNEPATAFRNELINGPISITDISGFYDSTRPIFVVPGNPTSFQTSIQSLSSPFRAILSFPFINSVNKIKDIVLAKWTTSFISSSVSQSEFSSSYAEVVIKNLDTFTGDIYRIKVFSKSRNDLKGFSLLEDIVIEAVELLKVDEYFNIINRKTGVFDENVILTGFWATKQISSPPVTPFIKTNSQFIASPVVVLSPQNDIDNINGLFSFNYVSGSSNQPLLLQNNTEYTLTFKTALSGSENAGYLDVYMSGSAFANTDNNLQYGRKLTTLSGFNIQTFDEQSLNFKPEYTGNATVSFVVRGGTWELADVGIKPSKQSAFTPGELRFFTKPNVQIPSESFDFRFELFDINYNYVPVNLEKTILFGGGNDILPALNISLSNNGIFLVSADGLSATPDYIDIGVQKVVITSPVVFYSSSVQYAESNAYKGPIILGANPDNIVAAGFGETGGNPITPISMFDVNSGFPYPGKLITQNPESVYRLYFSDFTSSLANNQRTEYIKYVAEAGGKVTPFVIGADYTNYTTTTTTTTTSTSTTSTTSTSTTSTTSTSTTVAPGSISFIEVANLVNTSEVINSQIISVQWKQGAGAWSDLELSPYNNQQISVITFTVSNVRDWSFPTYTSPIYTYQSSFIQGGNQPNNDYPVNTIGSLPPGNNYSIKFTLKPHPDFSVNDCGNARKFNGQNPDSTAGSPTTTNQQVTFIWTGITLVGGQTSYLDWSNNQ